MGIISIGEEIPINPVACQYYNYPYFCGEVPYTMNGYEMLQAGLYWKFIETYGIQCVIIFVVSLYVFHLYYQFCKRFWIEYERKKNQNVTYQKEEK